MNTAEEKLFGGDHGVDFDDGIHKNVKEISIGHGKCIYSFRGVYGKVRGPNVEKEKHGGDGINESIITLDPGEYLKMVSGHYGPVVDGGPDVIRSLTFVSNMKTYGPYGSEADPGIRFSFAVGGAKILGFKGRSGKHLIAFGVHYRVPWVEKLKNKLRR